MGPLSGDCNVGWSVPSQVAGCPLGDSLLFSPAKPARLRISIHYEDDFCNPKVGVPPDSIWVTSFSTTGNLRLNDSRAKIHADLPTDAAGNTRITMPAFSGCGTFTLRLYVSGKLVGLKTSTVRTTDRNADSCITSPDQSSVCDLNYNGTAGDATDAGLVGAHFSHAAVTWSLGDSMTACPAGDSLLTGHPAGRPTRMRLPVRYGGGGCSKLGVPPDSISVSWLVATGNLVVNDKSSVVPVYADDSTRALGRTWITIPSFSGCGTVVVQLSAAGIVQGTRLATVRTTDTNADGRTTSADAGSVCDLNYDGLITGGDASIVVSHDLHWKRNALHGTLVRRTNLAPPSQGNSIGGSTNTWSPNGRWVTFTTLGAGCRVWILASDPKDGDRMVQFTWNDTAGGGALPHRDYDPSWSPLGREIVFHRDDWLILRKGIPGVQGVEDTTQYWVTWSGSRDLNGDVTPSVSPDGQWLAFSRRDQVDPKRPFNIWKIRLDGTGIKRLTNTPGIGITDYYPRWSADGGWIIFDRSYPAYNIGGGQTIGIAHGIYKVPSDSGAVVQVYGPVEAPPDTFIAVTPAWSPDGLIVTAGRGIRRGAQAPVTTHTFDPALSSAQMKPIENFPGFFRVEPGLDPLPSPVLSPDGTRLMLATEQVWAARRNMSLPPRITQIDGNAVHDTAATVTLAALSQQVNTYQIQVTDSEGDALTCGAATHFLEPWMTFIPENCRLVAVPPLSAAGKQFFAKVYVTTPSGGTDGIVLAITVDPSLAKPPEMESAAPLFARPVVLGPNPTRGTFAVDTPPLERQIARLVIVDIAGHKVAEVRQPAGTRLVWTGKNAAGAVAPPGVYLYRMELAEMVVRGKVVVVR